MFHSSFRFGKGLGVLLGSLALGAINVPLVQAAPQDVIQFELEPANPALIPCLAAPGKTPKVQVVVQRGDRNDLMLVKLSGFKPGLKFDLFTVQNSLFQGNGTKDPNFKGFGLSWYQTDLEPGITSVRTILLDQIFGFVQTIPVTASPLPPTRTFHVGFWFNNPDDAIACNPNNQRIVTPFNGEFEAGPLAFISVPDPRTNLGPLCTKPNLSTSPASCDP
jgi:hypothetical protein